MQAIILAAGMGLRLRHETKNRPKCLVPVNGTSILERSLDRLASFALSRIVLVVGYRADLIHGLIGDSFRGIPVVYVTNPLYDSTNNIYSLYLARNLLADEDTLLLESDIVFDEAIIANLLACEHPNVAVVDKYRPRMDGTMVKIAKTGEISAIIPKAHFNADEIDAYYKTTNIYKFSKEFSTTTYIPFLEAYCSAAGHNRFYEQVLRVIIHLDQKNLKALVLDGEKWFEIDTVADLRDAEILFARDAAVARALFAGRYGGYWRFEQIRDFCYLTNPFFSPDGMIREIARETASLVSSYPSGQATQCTLAAELLRCQDVKLAVGNGASELICAVASEVEGTIGIFYPTFMEYPSRLPKERLITFHPPKEELRYTAADLMATVDHIDCLLLVNPDNPSGNFIDRRDLLKVVRHFQDKDKRIIIDESFVDFAVEGGPHGLVTDDLLDAFPNLTVIRSISKSYNVPGLRLGVVASADWKLVQRIRQKLPVWNINSFAEFFLQVAPKYAADYLASCSAIAKERERMFRELSKISFLHPLPSQSNFILCRLSEGWKGEDLANCLFSRFDTFLKSFSNREGLEEGEYVRIGVKSIEENDYLLRCLSQIRLPIDK